MSDLETRFRQYLACCNDRRFDEFPAYVHDPIQFNGTETPLAEYVATIRSNIEAFPDFHWEIQDLIANGDTVAVRLRDTGTQRGEWLGLPPSGQTMTTEEFAFYRWDHDRITAMWFVLDVPLAKHQLG